MALNFTGSRPHTGGIPRHVAWRQQYRARRYGEHLNRQELAKRLRDLILNLLVLTPEAKIGLLPITGDGPAWMEKWTHMLEEMVLRYGPYPGGFDRDILHSEPFPDLVSDLASNAAAALSSRGLNRGEVFIKFGRREHMEALIGRGALRIQPASYFGESGHNGAVRDDELGLPMPLWLSRDDIAKVVINPEHVAEDAPSQRVDIEVRLSRDYWMYCLTNSIQPRLFVDFNADTCVIIRDRTQFRIRLAEAARPVVGPAALVASVGRHSVAHRSRPGRSQ